MGGATLVRGGRILAGDRILEEADLWVERGKIRKIGRRLPASGARVVRAGGFLVSPGLIDTQINGGFGHSFSETSPHEVLEVGKKLLRHGVTSYLPTLISLPVEVTRRGIASLVAAATLPGGAEILGIHLEGPFLCPERRGAHRADHLRLPNLPEFRRYLADARGYLKVMTLAPELPGALRVLREGRRRGVLMSAGHSNATAAEIAQAVRQGGLRHITHVFNGMAPLHHREESILNAALLMDGLSCGFIYDRHHLSSGIARLLLKLKQPGSLVLVSDAVFALGAPDGEIRHDGEIYVVSKGMVTVKSTRRLAGSASSLLDGVRRLVEDTEVPVSVAIGLATAAPAKLLGVGKRKGVLRPGADADLVLLDQGLRVRLTMVRGTVLYEA